MYISRLHTRDVSIGSISGISYSKLSGCVSIIPCLEAGKRFVQSCIYIYNREWFHNRLVGIIFSGYYWFVL